jgi:hypothetical protein
VVLAMAEGETGREGAKARAEELLAPLSRWQNRSRAPAPEVEAEVEREAPAVEPVAPAVEPAPPVTR